MATPPVFSVGQYNTAAYMNSIGMWLVKTQAVGSTPVASITLTNCFNSDFNSYRIIVGGLRASGSQVSYGLRIGGQTSNYYGSKYYDLYTGATTNTLRTNAGSFLYCAVTDNDNTSLALDVNDPNKANITTFHGNYYGGGFSGWFSGTHAVSAAYTSFTIYNPSGTFTQGQISVYGYRN